MEKMSEILMNESNSYYLHRDVSDFSTPTIYDQ